MYKKLHFLAAKITARNSISIIAYNYSALVNAIDATKWLYYFY